MLQALAITEDDEILEIGSASGYLATCLARLGGRVRSIDADAGIVELAANNARHCGLANLEFDTMSFSRIDATQAWDVITLTASLPEVPDNLRQALRIGGRLFVIVGESPAMEALLITRVGESEWQTRSLFETDLPRLAH